MSASASYDGITLARRAGATLSVWSDAQGTYAALATKPPVRIAERCLGGLALTPEGDWLGCVRPAADEEQSEVVLLQLASDLSVTRSVRLGAAGRDGRAISLARVAGKLFAAWEAGQVGGPSVRLSELDQHGALLGEQSLSLPGSNGRQPALLAVANQLIAVWSESDLVPGGENHRLMIARDAGAPQQLRALGIASPAPSLAIDEQGLVIAYRDKRPRDLRAELYLARIGPDLKLRDKPHKLGRANSEGGPALALCGDTRAAIAPIDHASELYVAFHPLSPSLRVVEENHQFYATDREFVLAAALCTKQGLTALLAERTQPSRAASELLKVDFSCTE